MYIAICDDEAIYRKSIVEGIEAWREQHHLNDISFKTYASSEDLLDAWENGFSADVLLLDVVHPGELSGIELARRIRAFDQNVLIAFVTNFKEYACDGYDVDAFRYLTKPIRRDILFECLDLAQKRCSLNKANSFKLQSGNSLYVLSLKSIIYLEVADHTVTFYQTEGEPVQVYGKLKSYINELPADLFVQCHRSYVVNVIHIRKLQPDMLTLMNRTQIPIGKKYLNDTVALFQRVFLKGGT